MGVITAVKEWDDIHRALIDRGDLPVVVVGCAESARGCITGGRARVQALKERVRGANLMYHEPPGLPDALEQGLCDTTEVSRCLGPLRAKEPLQLLVLACGAGLWSVRDALPDGWVVPGLDTLGVGVGKQLACVACGDCGFGRAGCKMVKPRQRHADRLTIAYGKGGGR